MYANVDGLLSFEAADLDCGRVLASITAESAEFTHPAHHECSSHGIGSSPDGLPRGPPAGLQYDHA